jgi:hypothetical protein
MGWSRRCSAGCSVDFGALHRVAEQWHGIAVTVGINWLRIDFTAEDEATVFASEFDGRVIATSGG